MRKGNFLSYFIFGLLIVFAIVIRFWNLGNYPPLNADEAAIGYNAWSILKTGRDEHGDLFPIHFKSFGDYKPGLYFYLTIPFIKVLGLNEWAVRFPNFLASIGTIYLVFLLAKLLWKDNFLAFIWSLILSISPWHLHFSRGGWESNTAVFFILLGVYLFFKFGFRNFFVVLLPFVLSTYTYHSARITAPAILGGLMVLNWKLVEKNLKKILPPSFLAGILLLPLLFSFLKGGAVSRFSGVGIFADVGPLWRVNELINHHNWQGGFPFLRVFHNKIVIYLISFFQKYFSHFDGNFLFISGDSVPRSKLPEMGLFYLTDALFLFFGICFWLRRRNRDKYLPFLLLFAAPLASALTFQSPSALRSLFMVIPLTFFVSYGLKSLFLKLKDMPKFVLYPFCFFLFAFYLWNFFYWRDAYFNHYLKRYPLAWPDFRPIAEELKDLKIDEANVCIETKVDQPYILTLFYLKYPPEKIQKEIKLSPPDKFGFSTVKNFDRYYFGNCDGFGGRIVKEL